ncbi:thioredoxin-like protein [Hyaloraphidium curvatum]|nr:thioredoxin-like protein [Hyaloraphidium curvatum]
MATRPSLQPGDAAPAFDVSEEYFVQGGPAQPDGAIPVTLVECWATWCGPCRQTIPHVEELHRQFAPEDLRVVGVAVWERGSPEEIRDNVERFVREMGDKMTFPVCVDPPSPMGKAISGPSGGRPRSGRVTSAFLDAAGQNGIPTCFVVGRDGRVAWIGHPMAVDSVLRQCVDGTFDVEKAAKDHAEAWDRKQRVGKIKAAFDKAVWDKDYGTAELRAKEMVDVDPRNGIPILVQLYRGSMKAEPAKTVAFLDSVLANPDIPASQKQRAALTKLDVLLKDSKDPGAASSFGSDLLAYLEPSGDGDATNSASLLSALSHAIVGGFLALQAPGAVSADARAAFTGVAARAARRAADLGGRGFTNLDTLAEALWASQGKQEREEAVAVLGEALKAPDSPGGMAVRRVEAKIEAWEKELSSGADA